MAPEFTGSIEERVKQIILNEFYFEDQSQITPNTNFDELANKRYEILNKGKQYPEDIYDGLEILCIVMDAEKEFGIAISDKEARAIETVQDIIDIIRQKLVRRI